MNKMFKIFFCCAAVLSAVYSDIVEAQGVKADKLQVIWHNHDIETRSISMDDGTSTFCGYARHAYQNALTNRGIEHITINPDTSYEVNGLIRDKIMECPGKFQVLSTNAYFHLLMKAEEVVIRFPSHDVSFAISRSGQSPFLVDGKVDSNVIDLRIFNAEFLSISGHMNGIHIG